MAGRSNGMIFSPADIPNAATIPYGEVVEQVRRIDLGRSKPTSAQISDLMSRIDDSVARTHAAFDFILRYDAKWKTSVFRGETEYDEAIEKRIETALGNLADSSETLVTLLDRSKVYGLHSESLETLRLRIAEIRKMLIPDDQFFEGEALDELASRAIEEDDRGETVEFRVMGE